MTDDLSAKLAVLTEDRPEPSDPAAPVRLRIKHRRRRRRGTAVVATAAAVTAAALTAGPLVNSIRSVESGVAGSETPTVMPAPWSDELFTKMPDANAYRPHAYYIARLKIPTESFAVLAFSRQGCIATDEGPANSFGRIYTCFEEWKPGQRSAFYAAPAYDKEKSDHKLDFTLVVGAVSADARAVKVSAAGKTYTADAVGTPATDQLRFFAVLVPQKDAAVTAVTPLDSSGWAAAPPANPPTHQPCDKDCVSATPSK